TRLCTQSFSIHTHNNNPNPNPISQTHGYDSRILCATTFFTHKLTYFLVLLITEERMHQVQEQRKQHVKETCCDYKVELSDGKRSIDDINDRDLENLLVDDTHGIIYCFIPKVACSNWKKVMFVLKQGEPYRDPMSIADDLIDPTDKHLTFLKSFPRTEMMAKLKHYTKFLFVRDPFVRIISAYRDKLQRTNKYFYDNFGRNILRRYGNQSDPPRSLDEAFASGLSPSFHNFIQYLVDPKTENSGPFEPHWRQMHRLCHPCHIHYDFIGHQETLQDEAEQLLKLLMLQDDIKFPLAYVNMTSSVSMWDWFRTVPVEDRRKLYKLYESDFRLFGYRKPDEFLDG
uniref:Carbohydrate sulfotransferase n=2 Tax=Scophthalmus maximus TaxID=52904 RepID=A0A8D3E6K1_SCOMX